jgi:hypothetical protein
MGYATAVLPRRGREGGFTDDLQCGYFPNWVATESATSLIRANVKVAANGGILFFPEMTVLATNCGATTLVFSGPPKRTGYANRNQAR